MFRGAFRIDITGLIRVFPKIKPDSSDSIYHSAHGWDPSMTDDDLLAALLALNLDRAASQSDT